jgi:FAD/FMN-containing dehydrogenase
VSAGGIGENTHIHGGFWETVEALTVVTGAGDILTLRREDELFQWMFGAMGQLAFVVDATLRIRPLRPGAPYPDGEHGEVTRTPAQWERYAWFTLFVPFAKAQQAMGQLAEVAARHPRCWRPLSSYVYPVRFYRFNPRLLYPNQRGFVAVGIWGTPADPAAGFDFDAVRDLDAEVMALTTAHPEYRRYIQSEMTFGEVDYRAYFGAEVFNAFRALKEQFDPDGMLGQGHVFR